MENCLLAAKRKLFTLILLGLLGFTGYGQALGQPPRYVFPLQASENRRYLMDQRGTPFLYHADTGWQIYLKLTTHEATDYLAARRAQGFNTIQTQLATTPEDVNQYGQRPFKNNNDFAQPNEAYYDHIADVITKADSLGMLVVMSGPWLECCRGGFGMLPDKPYQKNGPAKNRAYGRYLGNKFKKFTNLMWIMGGDNDPGQDREAIEQLALGIRETAPHQLITYHAAATHSSTDLFQYAPWLDFSMVYTYWRGKGPIWLPADQVPEVYEVCLKEYNKSDRMPFVLGEAEYEGPANEGYGSPERVRRQAYWTLLSGGNGHAYGSAAFYFPPNWRTILASSGAKQMGYLVQFFTELPWWQLVPDQRHQLITNGYGEYGKPNYVTAAVTTDKTLAVAYLTAKQPLTVDLNQLKGKTLTASWFNPRDGKTISAGQVIKKSQQQFLPPTSGDWVLVIKGN